MLTGIDAVIKRITYQMREYSNARVYLLGCIGPVIIDIHVKFFEVNRIPACFALSVCVAFLGPVVNSLMISRSYFNSKLFSMIGKVLAFLLLFPTNMDAGYFTMDETWEEKPTGRRMHG